MRPIHPVLLVFLFASAYSYAAEHAKYDQADTTQTTVPPSAELEGNDAMPLSAFFGADNAFPPFANRFICEGAAGLMTDPIEDLNPETSIDVTYTNKYEQPSHDLAFSESP